MISIIFLAVLLVAIILGGCAVYVRISQKLYTENRFNFVALWACLCSLTALLFFYSNVSPTTAVLSYFGFQDVSYGLTEKFLATIVVLFFIRTASNWARDWNGKFTVEGYERTKRGHRPSLLVDGLAETWRIVNFRPALAAYDFRGVLDQQPMLPTPISAVPFHNQVRDLIVSRWPEYDIPHDQWIAEATCWRGRDDALDLSLLVVCTLSESELNRERLYEQIIHEKDNGHLVRVMFVIRENEIGDDVIGPFSELVHKSSVISFKKLLEETLPLDAYKREIEKEFVQHRLPNANFSLSEIFVDTKIRVRAETQTGKYSVDGSCLDLKEFISAWALREGTQHIALLGDYGQGKSSAALELAYRILHDEKTAKLFGHRIPILIRLTGLSPMSSTPEELLGAWGTKYGLNGRALLAMHTAGQAILIFDAFDEMSGVSDQADRINHFASLWRYACRGSKLIFTGRPNFFLDDEELKNALGIARSGVGAYCTAAYIEPFSQEQMRKSLKWLPNSKRDELLEAIERLPSLEAIAERPSLLFQLSRLWSDGRITLDRAELESATIIKAFVEYCIERQVAKQFTDVASKQQDRNFIPLRHSELLYFTKGCAIAALDQGRNNFLPEAVFHDTINKLWNAIDDDDLFSRRTDELAALSLGLKERFRDQHDPTEVCAQAVRTHGVIEHDPANRGVYKFSHKSFAEVLAATTIMAGALGVDKESLVVWKASKPISLIGQDTIFKFCNDLNKSIGQEGSTISEHLVYSNISSRVGGVLGKLMYEYMRLGVKETYAPPKSSSTAWLRRFLLLVMFFPLDSFLTDARRANYGVMAVRVRSRWAIAGAITCLVLYVALLIGLGMSTSDLVAFSVGVATSAFAVSFLSIFSLMIPLREQGSISLSTRILFCYMIATHGKLSTQENQRVVQVFEDILSKKLDSISLRSTADAIAEVELNHV